MWVVPINGVTVQLPAAKHWGEAASVDLCSEGLDARHFQNRRVEVERDCRGRFNRAWLGDAGPKRDQRYAHAAFIGRTLTGSVGTVLGDRELATVIAGEENHGIILEF